MAIIPRNLHFIWVGKIILQKYMQNILNWVVQNPRYEVHLWTEAAKIAECLKMAVDIYQTKPSGFDMIGHAAGDTQHGQRVRFTHRSKDDFFYAFFSYLQKSNVRKFS